MEIQEILRRLRGGESDRAIHRVLRMRRETVKKYRRWATASFKGWRASKLSK